jgi:glycosyltransferase involved in cell wall biosynthesis
MLSSAPSVTAVGHLSDPSDWLAAADVVAVPSRWEAGLPLVAREAMACARSVVMSDVPGAREDLPHAAGSIVAMDDVDGLADALVTRLRDPDLADREGEVGGAHAAGHFDIAVTSERVAQMYADLSAAFTTAGSAES